MHVQFSPLDVVYRIFYLNVVQGSQSAHYVAMTDTTLQET